MERAAGLLNVFYNGVNCTNAERQQAHVDLVALLRNPETADSAARFVQAAGSTFATGGSVPVDAVVLHYALHALEERARSAAFSELPAAAVRSSVDLLVSFVVSAYARTPARRAHRRPSPSMSSQRLRTLPLLSVVANGPPPATPTPNSPAQSSGLSTRMDTLRSPSHVCSRELPCLPYLSMTPLMTLVPICSRVSPVPCVAT